MDPLSLTNLGAAGLIAAMWLVERRAAAARERALEQAHDRLTSERQDADTLIRLVRDSTRALVAVERTQRAVLALLERLAQREGAKASRCQGAKGAETSALDTPTP